MLTWNERKRQDNLHRHGLDFKGYDAVFDAPVVTVEDSRWGVRRATDQLARLACGPSHPYDLHRAGEDLHVVSLRKATRHEARNYFKILSPEP